MGKLVPVARILLGLVFFVFGLNGVLIFVLGMDGFIPMPEEMPEGAAAFMGGLGAAGYFFQLLKLTETVCGALLLVGLYVPLALVVLAPIVLNIVLYHLFLDPGGVAVGLVVLVLEIFLAWSYRGSFHGVLARKAQPT
jgi:uncharacterized membrane protein YphA (DoxX/SURF4 family)